MYTLDGSSFIPVKGGLSGELRSQQKRIGLLGYHSPYTADEGRIYRLRAKRQSAEDMELKGIQGFP